jgi:hypothetical protein
MLEEGDIPVSSLRPLEGPERIRQTRWNSKPRQDASPKPARVPSQEQMRSAKVCEDDGRSDERRQG